MGLFDNGLFANYNDQISKLISQKPQYQINPEYSENQGIARNKAYGRNRAFQTQETNVEQEAANDINSAQQYGSSTSSILNTLSSITGNKMNALRGIGQDEAQYQGQALNDVAAANTAMAEEKDKAWNYNVNEPYQMKLKQLVDKKKARAEALGKVLDIAGTVGSFALGGPIGAGLFMGAKKSTGGDL